MAEPEESADTTRRVVAGVVVVATLMIAVFMMSRTQVRELGPVCSKADWPDWYTNAAPRTWEGPERLRIAHVARVTDHTFSPLWLYEIHVSRRVEVLGVATYRCY
jgi:hypothetical protein